MSRWYRDQMIQHYVQFGFFDIAFVNKFRGCPWTTNTFNYHNSCAYAACLWIMALED